MNKINIGFQLWSIHDLFNDESNIEMLIEQIKLAGYDGVELYNIADPKLFKQVTTALKKFELPIMSAHCDYNLVDKDLENLLSTYKSFGMESIVIPMAIDITNSATMMHQIINRLAIQRKKCLEAGMELYYHNHMHECLILDNDYILNHLGNAGIKLEYDLHWLVRGGLDPYSFVANNYPATQLHIKDVMLVKDNNEFKVIDCAVGNGNLDLARVAQIANEKHIKWLIVEQEYNAQTIEQRIEDIKTSFNSLNEIRR